MTVDVAILMLLADLQRTIEALRAENAELHRQLDHIPEDVSS